MTKMAAMPIYGQNPLKVFSRTRRLIWYVALGMWGLQSFSSNDEAGLALTSMLHLLPNAFKWGKILKS